MDEDTRQLIRHLCTRAGMIMEDASSIALLAPQEERLAELRRAAEQVTALLAAAQALQSE